MPRKLSLRRRLSTAAGWPVGSGRRPGTTSGGRRTCGRSTRAPAGTERGRVQQQDAGVGPVFHRRYGTRIREARLTAEQLIDRIADRVRLLRQAARRTRDDAGRRRVPGAHGRPWDGPVGVIDRTSRSFAFVTLDGHLEAGQIRSSAQPYDGMVVFEIESWRAAPAGW